MLGKAIILTAGFTVLAASVWLTHDATRDKWYALGVNAGTLIGETTVSDALCEAALDKPLHSDPDLTLGFKSQAVTIRRTGDVFEIHCPRRN